MKEALVIGGSNGIGLAIAIELSKYNFVHIVDREKNDEIYKYKNIDFVHVNLLNNNYSFLQQFPNIKIVVVTVGFGRVSVYDKIVEKEIDNSFLVNTVSVLKILHFYFNRMKQKEDFKCAVMGSIAGIVSSPLFALYGSTKAAVCNAIESLNIELEMAGTNNRILNVSPGSIKGTKFNGGQNDLTLTQPLAKEIIIRMNNHETLFIPQYEEIYQNVINRYHKDAHQYGLDSFHYKQTCGRVNDKPQLKIGYLSGTFDLFHIGHLNILRRAKEYCDYLVVGVHKDASHKGKETFIPYQERVDILESIRYVDKVIPSEKEDCDVYKNGIVKYDYLFVGSDYKGSKRFNKYEEFFKGKGVKIIYFPYTQGTSSTQLREALSKNINKNG